MTKEFNKDQNKNTKGRVSARTEGATTAPTEKISKKIDFRAMAIVTAIVIAIFAAKYWPNKNNSFIEPEDISEKGRDSLRLGSGNAEFYYPIPKISSKEELFCRGAVQSDSCSKRPFHPHYESMRLLGTPLPEREPDRKYIDKQTQKRFWFFDW